jgi:hypothetical protein
MRYAAGKAVSRDRATLKALHYAGALGVLLTGRLVGV